MTILVFGQNGQVARELMKLSSATQPILALNRDSADLSDPQACAEAIENIKPVAVINAAAYTAVDAAEADEHLAMRINADAPEAMAKAAAAMKIPFVQISTDYVFDGSGLSPRTPDSACAPLGVYGRSKAIGEDAIRTAGGTYAILRTSWVFSAHGNNFVKTMLRLSETRDSLDIVDDQVGGPTAASAIARACLMIASTLISDPSKTGTYHYSGTPDVSWKDFACEIFERAGRGIKVRGIPTSAYVTAAKRPMNSKLDCQSTITTFGLPQPEWHADLNQVLDDLGVDKMMEEL
jgi:dTDP-4-dehydrorhamnose reductase